MSRANVVVLLSGGIDSTSCVQMLKNSGHEVMGLFVDFGQAAGQMERRSVEKIGHYYGIECNIIEVSNTAGFGAGELIGRNAFLIFSAIMIGRVHSGLLAIGIHSGTEYYDCSPHFLDRVNILAGECSRGGLSVIAPLLNWEKHDIYSYAIEQKIPIEVTYSCEFGLETACGTCASCKDRKNVFC